MACYTFKNQPHNQPLCPDGDGHWGVVWLQSGLGSSTLAGHEGCRNSLSETSRIPGSGGNRNLQTCNAWRASNFYVLILLILVPSSQLKLASHLEPPGCFAKLGRGLELTRTSCSRELIFCDALGYLLTERVAIFEYCESDPECALASTSWQKQAGESKIGNEHQWTGCTCRLWSTSGALYVAASATAHCTRLPSLVTRLDANLCPNLDRFGFTYPPPHLSTCISICTYTLYIYICTHVR